MIKVYYPTYLPGGNWYFYLRYGFRKLKDIEFIFSPELRELGHKPMAIDIEIDGKKTRCWYDKEDFVTIYPQVTEKENNLYFKIAYSKLIKYPKNVIPMAQTALFSIIYNLDKLRELKAEKEYKYDIIGIFKLTNFERRLQIIKMLKKQSWNSQLYLIRHGKFQIVNKVPKEILKERLPYLEHWKLQAQSKINLDITGFNDNISWRKADILAMGGFCLTEKANRVLTAPNDNCWEEYESLSDLIDKINFYLTHDEERETIAKNGIDYYEKHLSPKAQAQYIINKVKEKNEIF